MTISPRYAIADVTAQLKSQFSLQIRAEFTRLKQMYFSYGDSLSAALAQKMNIMQNFKDDRIWVGSDWSCNEMASAPFL